MCYVLRYVLRFGKCYVLGSLGTAKCNTGAKHKTMLRFARPPFTFWVLCRRNNYYVLRNLLRFALSFYVLGNVTFCGPTTSTTDALVEMTNRWYEATDKLNTYVRVVMLDFSKSFDLINHHILLDTLTNRGFPVNIVR